MSKRKENNNFGRLLPALLLLILATWSCRTAAPPANAPVEFIILQLNDVYEITPLEGGKAGGLARVATIRQQLLAENPNTITILAGDFLSPSLVGSLRDSTGERIAGRHMVETLNALGVDYVTFGNHEFDLSDPALLQQRIDQSNFRYVISNVLRSDVDRARPFTQLVDGRRVDIPPYLIHEISRPGGQPLRIGLIGVLLPFNKADYITYKPVNESFLDALRSVQPQSDLVIGITHLDMDQDKALADLVDGAVPLFLGGHEHEHATAYIDGTVIAKADANAKSVYIHRLRYYPEAGVTKVRSTLQVIDDRIPAEPVTQAVVTRWRDLGISLIGKMGYDASRRLTTLAEPLIGTEDLVRNQPTNYGILTAEAMRAAWPGADLYLFGSGGLRLDDRLIGTVTVYDVLRSFPFGGSIVRARLPGSAVARLLENGLVKNKGTGGYPQLIQAQRLGNTWVINDRPLEHQDQYDIVLPKFIMDGKEANLGFLADYSYKDPATLEVNGEMIKNDIRDIVISYMGSQ